jgi:PAS domain S-box-containing protein
MLNAYALHEIICDEQGKPVDYRFLDVNLAFEQMTGFKAESMVGRTVLEIMPRTEPSWIEIYGNVALTGEPVHFEDFSRELNRYYEVVAFRPAANQFACSFTDITNRKMAELALIAAKKKEETSKEYLENVINNMGDPVFVKDDQSQLVMVNDAFCTIFDLSRDQIIGKTLAENVPPDEREHFLRVDRQVLADGKENLTEERLTIRGGHTRTILTRKSRFIDSGNNKFLVGIIRDISDRKEAELALATEKERLAVTLRSIGDGVITTDTDGKIVMLNKVAEELTGWHSTEAIRRPLPEVFNIINERTRQPMQNPVERVLASNDIVQLANNTSLITKDGREIIIADSGAPIRDDEGELIGVVLVFRDMTEKQKLEDYMQKSQKLESLGVLAGGIAHDFNNLLGAIFGYTEIAKSKSSEENVINSLNKSMQNIDRARALTQQLLTFAKGGEPVRSVTDLFPFVQETVQFALSGSSVSAKYQIQENLWPCHIDKNQIGQVIDNLTINAQQAMPNGGMIEILAQNVSLAKSEHVSLPAGNYVKLSIRDKGIGIPKNHFPNIFDPYFTTKTKGHGLGLATCYSIIDRHEGFIDVESELGKGSTFHVYLPASVEPISDIAMVSIGQHTGNGTFLVMDDEEVIREVLKEILESYGYTVVITKTGEEALAFCMAEARANRNFAGMIFDLTIPGGMGGEEAIAEIRKVYPDTPAFVASGYSEDPIIAHPHEYGFTASLRKPFTIKELSDMLETHLGKR